MSETAGGLTGLPFCGPDELRTERGAVRLLGPTRCRSAVDHEGTARQTGWLTRPVRPARHGRYPGLLFHRRLGHAGAGPAADQVGGARLLGVPVLSLVPPLSIVLADASTSRTSRAIDHWC